MLGTRTKHIEVHYHFIQERVLVGDVDLQHVSTNLQTADIFTKALGTEKLWQFMTDLGLTISGLPSLRGSTEEQTAKHAKSRASQKPKHGLRNSTHRKLEHEFCNSAQYLPKRTSVNASLREVTRTPEHKSKRISDTV